MSGKHLTPQKRSEAIALKAAGYTQVVIAEKLGVSTRTMTRLFAQCQRKPEPIRDEIIDRVRDQMIAEVTAPKAIQSAVAASVLDDLAYARLIRSKALEVIEALSAGTHNEARECAKALGQMAQTIKVTQAVARIALGANDREDSEAPTVLVIREMTAEDVERAREASRSAGDLDTDDV